jgi:hypothetical protein
METTSAAHLNRCVLVEGPAWGDAEFLSKWLLAAAQAESFWRKAYENADFEKQVEPVCVCYIPDFGISAFIMVMHLKEHRTSFVLNLETEDGELFAMMLGMGFFEPSPNGYRMALPIGLTTATVRAAVIKFAATQDDDFILHPEHLVSTMPFAEARLRQDRLCAIEEFQHCPHLGSG